MPADFGAVPDSWMPDWAALLEGAPYVHMDLPCGVQTTDGTGPIRAHGLSFSLTEKQQQFTGSYRHYKQRGPSINKHWGWTRWDAIQRQGPIGSIPADADDRSMDDFCRCPLLRSGPLCCPQMRSGPLRKQPSAAGILEFLPSNTTKPTSISGAVFQNPEWKDYMSVGLTVIFPANIWRNAAQFHPKNVLEYQKKLLETYFSTD